jgi:hypothetical protein
MARFLNGVRGIRTRLAGGTVVGRVSGTGAAQQIPLSKLLAGPGGSGVVPGGAPPVLSSAVLDAVFGSTEGSILIRGASVWALLTPGTTGYVLTSNGSGAVPSYQAAGGGGVTFTNKGAWNGDDAYTVGDVVQYNGSAYLCYENINAPATGASLDGSAATGVTSSGSGNSSVTTGGLTTSLSNDIIIVCVSALAYSAAPVVSSISDTAGLTWTLREAYNYTPPFPGANGYQTQAVYWAHAPSALSGDDITVNFTGAAFATITAFAINGVSSLTNPFDSNGSLPATNSNAGPSAPDATASTSNVSDAIVFTTAMAPIDGGGAFSSTPPTGFTQISNLTSGGGSNAGTSVVFYEHISGQLSGSTITLSDSHDYWSIILDAVDGGEIPNAPPSTDDTHWLSQGAYTPPTPPTTTSTGLTSDLNIGSVAVNNNSAGIGLNAPSDGSSQNLRGIFGAVPSTPYTITGLSSMFCPGGNYGDVAMGWYDGSAKLQVMRLGQTNSNTGELSVDNWASDTSYSSSPYSVSPAYLPTEFWWQLEDDGTNVYFKIGPDGETWITLYTVAKASGYLGSSGYANIFVGVHAFAAPVIHTLLSFST